MGDEIAGRARSQADGQVLGPDAVVVRVKVIGPAGEGVAAPDIIPRHGGVCLAESAGPAGDRVGGPGIGIELVEIAVAAAVHVWVKVEGETVAGVTLQSNVYVGFSINVEFHWHECWIIPQDLNVVDVPTEIAISAIRRAHHPSHVHRGLAVGHGGDVVSNLRPSCVDQGRGRILPD